MWNRHAATMDAKRRPRVAILTNYPYDGVTFTGGVETATDGLLEGLAGYTQEFDFHVMSLSRRIRQHVTEQRGGMTHHFLAIPSAWYARPHVLPNIMNAHAALKKLQPDLVHCQDNMALAMAAMYARTSKRIFTVHGIKSVESRVWEGPEYWSHMMDAVLEGWVRKHFDEVITISPYVDRFLPAHVRKHHIPNPVRRLFFDDPQSGERDRRILFVGVLTRLKRPMDVIQAFARVRQAYPDASLTIVGEAEDQEYLKEMTGYVAAERLGGVEFLGRQNQRRIASLMRESSVLVVASVQENSPMVIAEAMASGLPVIASNVGGVPMMIRDGFSGVLFSCGDVDQLADHIAGMFENGERRGAMSENARRHACSTYSSGAVALATVNLYRGTLGV